MRNRGNIARRRCTLLVAALAGTGVYNVSKAQTVASWLSPVNGSWTSSSQWSVSPNNPNGYYDAIIAAPGGTYTVTLTSPITLNSLQIGTSGAQLRVTNNSTLTASTINLSNGGRLILSAGRIKNATITGDGTVSTEYPNGGFDAVTLAVPLNATNVSIFNGITLDNTVVFANGNLPGGSGAADFNFYQSQHIAGQGTILIDNDMIGIVNYPVPGQAELTIDPGITVNNGTHGGGFTTQYAFSGKLINKGTIHAKEGGFVLETLSWVNQGTFIVDANASLWLGGSFSPSNLGAIQRSGGTIVLAGQIDSTGQVFESNASTGSFLLGNGGTFTGGTLRSRDGTVFTLLPGSITRSYTLDGATLDGEISTGSVIKRLYVVNGLAMLPGSKLASGAQFEGTQAVIGTGELVDVIPHGGTLTLGAGITSRGLVGDIDSSNSASDIVNYGTLIATPSSFFGFANLFRHFDNYGTAVIGTGAYAKLSGSWINSGTILLTGGGGLEIAAGEWINAGFVRGQDSLISLTGQWQNSGSIQLVNTALNLSGAFPRAAIGSIIRTSGTINLLGQLDNSGTVLALDDVGGDWHLTSGGNISGGSIITGASTLYGGTGGSISSLTFNGQLTLEKATNFTAVSVVNNGTITVPAKSTFKQPTIVNNGTIAITGGTLTLLDGWSNPGSITLNTGTLNINLNTGSQINAGTVSGNGAIVVSGTWKMSDLGTINRTGGYFAIDGTFDNVGKTLTVDNIGTWTLFGSSAPGNTSALVMGGTINSVNGGVLEAGSAGGSLTNLATLDNVIVDTTIRIWPATTLVVTDGVELLHNAQIAVGTSFGGTVATLALSGTQSLAGNGEIVFVNRGGATMTPKGGMITIGSGITVRTGGGAGTIGLLGNKVINQGTVSSQTFGKKIQINGTFENQGTVQSLDGGTLVLPSPFSVTNFTSGTLTGGTWLIGAGSTMTFATQGTIATNNATVLMTGVGAVFTPFNSLRSNLANLTISGGGSFATSGSLSNSGTISVGNRSTLKVLDTFDNVAGLLDLSGNLIVDYTTTSPLDTLLGQIGTHIVSSAQQAGSSKIFGYTDNGDVVTIALTFGGDANLDQMVDIRDLYQLASHWQTPGSWQTGDFNDDDMVDTKDLAILANNWQAGAASASGAASLNTAILASLGLPEVSVPEPFFAMPILAGMITGVFRRRRRHHTH